MLSRGLGRAPSASFPDVSDRLSPGAPERRAPSWQARLPHPAAAVRACCRAGRRAACRAGRRATPRARLGRRAPAARSAVVSAAEWRASSAPAAHAAQRRRAAHCGADGLGAGVPSAGPPFGARRAGPCAAQPSAVPGAGLTSVVAVRRPVARRGARTFAAQHAALTGLERRERRVRRRPRDLP